MEILEAPKGRGSTHGVHLIQTSHHQTNYHQARGILYSYNKENNTPSSSPPRITHLPYRIKAASLALYTRWF
jgi:hypothetical protein